MRLTDVPLDVQLQILQLCSPKDLAAVSRVHSSLRDAAERVLYSRIDISSQEPYIEMDRSPWELAAKKTAPLLSTLAINTWKASRVKAFYIELGVEDDNDYGVLHLILVALAGVLEKMPNLVDLRILTNGQVDLSQGTVSKVIGGGYFKLETLYLDFCWHDLNGAIAGQPQLRFFGLYGSDSDMRRIWREVKRLHQIKNCQYRHASSGPAIFTLDFVTLSCTREITVFPVFHRSVDAPQVLQQISVHPYIHDLDYDDGLYDVSLSLFGISEDNIHLFCEVLEAMEMSARRRLYPKLSRKSYRNLKIIVHETTIQRLHQIKNCHCRHISSGPAIFILDFFALNNTCEITIFPVFHRSVDAPQVFQQISVHPNIHDLYRGDGYNVSLSLFGISEDNIHLFCEVLEAMETCARRRLYPKLTWESYKILNIIVHETTIHKPWLSPEFTKSLAQFKSVECLRLEFPNIEDAELYSLSADLRECLLKGLGHGEWAGLREIDLQGPRNRVLLNREENWGPPDEHW
ncbi:hypothetical protein F5887DRAFT_976925 [Amanita rubescens]|nr:hypothetical protein F5887DRAFT_976925 [Amanita rubescens]